MHRILGRTDGGLLMLLFNLRNEPSAELAREMARLAALIADMERIHRGVPPEVITGDDAPVLDRWIFAERGVPCLADLSMGHPELAGESRPICTSELWLLSKDRSWARTFSRWYRLGRPAEQSGLNA